MQLTFIVLDVKSQRKCYLGGETSAVVQSTKKLLKKTNKMGRNLAFLKEFLLINAIPYHV